MDLLATIKDFMLTEAVSGYEKKMAYKLKDYFDQYSDETYIDKAGNTIAKISGTETDPEALTLMIFAHVDQLGFIVRKIENSGLIQVDRLGGIPEKVLPGATVSVSTIDGDYIPGVFGNKSHHATSPEEKYKVDTVTSLLIDIGASSREEVMNTGIHIGCPVCYKPSFTKLQENRISGTSVDNRAGCAALVGVAEALSQNSPKVTVYLVGTVWEEFNIRGAIFAARSIKPDLALCIDVALPGDTPDLMSRYDLGLGEGPTVTLYNFHGRGTLNGNIAHQGLYRHALACAEASGINLQEFASLGLLTDSAYVQLEHNYIGCLDIGFPVRYTHSPVETCDIADIKELIHLLTYMVNKMDKNFSLSRF